MNKNFIARLNWVSGGSGGSDAEMRRWGENTWKTIALMGLQFIHFTNESLIWVSVESHSVTFNVQNYTLQKKIIPQRRDY